MCIRERDVVGSGPELVGEGYHFDPLIVSSAVDFDFADVPSAAAQRLEVDFCRQELPIAIDGGQAEGALTAEQRNEFQSDLCSDLKRLERWAIEFGWSPGPIAQLGVFVSDRCRISKSLVPAWSGYPGYMRFPASRVQTRTAAILHELVHVFFPNGNRFLAEGLAVYLQALLGGNPAFPNFGKPLHDTARDQCVDKLPALSGPNATSLRTIHLDRLDAIATPNPLTLTIEQEFFGEGPRGQALLYAIAGSFTQFVIEMHGIDKFYALYRKTPLVMRAQDPGPASRWLDVYRVPLLHFQNDWHSFLNSRGELIDDPALENERLF